MYFLYLLKYYYIRVLPNLGQGLISLCISFSGKSDHIYPCQTYYIIARPTENITWWWNQLYPYTIINFGWFYGVISTLIGVTLQDHHIPFLDTSMIFTNVCNDSTQSPILGLTPPNCGGFYYLYHYLLWWKSIQSYDWNIIIWKHFVDLFQRQY